MKRIPYGHQLLDGNDIKEVVKVLKSDFLTQGPKIKEFEDALCKYTGAKYAVSLSSGTAALHLACIASGIKSKDEVITSPITFVASANCILYCGAKPVFADIQEETVNIDPDEIKKKLTRNTKAIIPVDFAGHPCDLEEIYAIAKKNGLLVIEDAAHALGAEYKGSKIGSCKYSDMTIFSFHPIKSITTGEGGSILTNNRQIYQWLLLLRNHGITKARGEFINKNAGDWYYEMQHLGFNYRLTDLQSALGISQLRKIDKFLRRRREIADIYNKELSAIDEIILPIERPYVKSSWHIYQIRLKAAKRKHIFKELKKAGIGVQVHYIPVYLQPYYRNNLRYKENNYPVAKRYYRETLTLPLFPAMADSDIKYVVTALKKAL